MVKKPMLVQNVEDVTNNQTRSRGISRKPTLVVDNTNTDTKESGVYFFLRR